MTRNVLKRAGIKTPYAKDLHINMEDEIEPLAYDLFRSFPMPVVVKPRNLNFSAKDFFPYQRPRWRLLVVKRDDLKLIRFSIIYKII
jgi:hypothetical protein